MHYFAFSRHPRCEVSVECDAEWQYIGPCLGNGAAYKHARSAECTLFVVWTYLFTNGFRACYTRPVPHTTPFPLSRRPKGIEALYATAFAVGICCRARPKASLMVAHSKTNNERWFWCWLSRVRYVSGRRIAFCWTKCFPLPFVSISAVPGKVI